MKRKIQIGVGSVGQALDRFERTWERGAREGGRGVEVRLSFESLPLLLKNLTPARARLQERAHRCLAPDRARSGGARLRSACRGVVGRGDRGNETCGVNYVNGYRVIKARRKSKR